MPSVCTDMTVTFNTASTLTSDLKFSADLSQSLILLSTQYHENELLLTA